MSIEKFEKGNARDLDRIYSLYERCKNDLLSKNILQWGSWYDSYPNLKYLQQAIVRKELFVLALDNDILGAAVLNEKQADKWETISWDKAKSKALVIHAFVIDPKNQHKGFGKKLLVYCEQYARDNKYESIRLDSFKKNDMANRFYQKFGYANIGTVIFNQKPEGNREYYCYEKLL